MVVVIVIMTIIIALTHNSPNLPAQRVNVVIVGG